MRECECTENLRKEKYIRTIFTVIINFNVNSQLNGFHKSNDFHDYLISGYTGMFFKREQFLKACHRVA